MAVLRLTKGSREYILRTEREGYWENRIKKLEEEIAGMPGDHEELEDKQEELKELQKLAEKAKDKLAKYPPTIFKLHTVSKSDMHRAMSKLNITLGTAKSIRKGEFHSNQITYAMRRALEIVKLGLDGWENLIDELTGQPIGFDRNLIEQLDDNILAELGNEISGDVSEEESGN